MNRPLHGPQGRVKRSVVFRKKAKMNTAILGFICILIWVSALTNAVNLFVVLVPFLLVFMVKGAYLNLHY